MTTAARKYRSIPLGIVIRRVPGVTRWAKWTWRAVAVLPGAAPAKWKILVQTGDAIDYHATTLSLELHASDAEAYRLGLSTKPPSVYILMRETHDEDYPIDAVSVTASPYEAEDYTSTGDQLVEKVAMPEGLVAWVQDFADMHYKEQVFVKRQRDKQRRDLVEEGVGDPRISQLTDVYRAPSRKEQVP